MANTTMLFGILTILLGVISYVGTGSKAPTALIPAYFGIVLLILGAIARDPGKRKHAMHGAAAVGLLGLVGGLRGVPDALRMAQGEAVKRPAATISQVILCVLMLVFVALCVRSFVAARRARTV